MADRAIAVVIPTYNRAALIRETLAAIYAQTLAPRAIIVVDDGSTDDTAAVLAAEGDRIRVLRIANGGDLRARNAGIAAAEADLIAFCDSDDLWEPEFLAEMAALWQAEPALCAAYGDFVLLRDGVRGTVRKFADAPAGFWDELRPLGGAGGVFDRPIAERLIRFQPFFPSALVARADFLRAIGGWDEGVSRIVGSDLATALRITAHAPIGVLRRPLVAIRKHGENFSGDTQAMELGDSLVLEHALRTNPYLAPHAATLRASTIARRRAALDTAFARGDLAGVRAIADLLGPALGRAGRVKAGIARLPGPLARAGAAVLLAAGSLRARS
ncbi:MAG: glycosyltransferase family 2 protein [Rhodospirillales bacterium]|nr:glycosyltransferase family 2 protein [Rhodospirillales bacterium]